MSEQIPTRPLILVMRAAVLALLAAITVVPAADAQMKTESPPPVPGAKPVTVEHIKVLSAATPEMPRASPPTAT